MDEKFSRFQKLQLTRPILSLTVLRILVGHIFVVEGTGKLFGWFHHGGLEITTAFFRDIGIPFPQLNAIVVGCVETLCGLGLMAGFLTRMIVVPVSVIMVIAIITVHSTAGYYYPLVLCASFFVLIQSGAGSYSVDGYMSAQRMQDSFKPYVKLKDR